jgi:hypothetical protein
LTVGRHKDLGDHAFPLQASTVERRADRMTDTGELVARALSA